MFLTGGDWPTRLGVLALGMLCVAWPAARAQTGLLNDTGQTLCYSGADAAVTCDGATAGNTGVRPHQDGRFGRDVASPTKTGSGIAGFDFSCVLWNGTVIDGANCRTGLTANTTQLVGANATTDWACTKDNVTGLVWSLNDTDHVLISWSQATASTFPNSGHNHLSRCGYSSGWRLPTLHELSSLIHHGRATEPMLDLDFFPRKFIHTDYWASNSYAPDGLYAWFVSVADGGAAAKLKTAFISVRLVRSTP
jgi:hypothetical protein